CASRIAHLPLSRCYKVAPEWLYRAVPVCHCHWAGPSYVPSHFAITPLAISGACAALAAPRPDCPGTHLHAPNRKKTAVAQTSLAPRWLMLCPLVFAPAKTWQHAPAEYRLSWRCYRCAMIQKTCADHARMQTPCWQQDGAPL